jgi:hypothetical protein
MEATTETLARPTQTVDAATAKQIAFIGRLLSERDRTNEEARATCETVEMLIADGHMNKKAASAAISLLFKVPKATTPTGPKAEVPAPGLFTKDGEIFKIKATKAGKRWAHHLDLGSWHFDKAATFSLTEDDRMTLDQAKAFGLETGICIMCSRVLTVPASIEAGIGPVCANKF